MCPLEAMIAAESHASVHRAISNLPDIERLVFRMIAVEGFGEVETATCIAMRPSKVRQAMERARVMLRARLT